MDFILVYYLVVKIVLKGDYIVLKDQFGLSNVFDTIDYFGNYYINDVVFSFNGNVIIFKEIDFKILIIFLRKLLLNLLFKKIIDISIIFVSFCDFFNPN